MIGEIHSSLPFLSVSFASIPFLSFRMMTMTGGGDKGQTALAVVN